MEKEPKGFLRGLRDFLKMLEEMEKKGEKARTVSGEVEGPGYSKVTYDYSVKLGLGKEDFLVDVFDKGDHILVVAELPNVKEEDIALEAAGNVLKIAAKTPRGRFERDIEVPEGSKVEKVLMASFKNGVLEIRLSKRGDLDGG